jgi:hypothetical protein
MEQLQAAAADLQSRHPRHRLNRRRPFTRAGVLRNRLQSRECSPCTAGRAVGPSAGRRHPRSDHRRRRSRAGRQGAPVHSPARPGCDRCRQAMGICAHDAQRAGADRPDGDGDIRIAVTRDRAGRWQIRGHRAAGAGPAQSAALRIRQCSFRFSMRGRVRIDIAVVVVSAVRCS